MTKLYPKVEYFSWTQFKLGSESLCNYSHIFAVQIAASFIATGVTLWNVTLYLGTILDYRANHTVSVYLNNC